MVYIDHCHTVLYGFVQGFEMKEKRTLICESNGKRIIIPDVTKIILSIKRERERHQASIDMTIRNLCIIRRRIR